MVHFLVDRSQEFASEGVLQELGEEADVVVVAVPVFGVQLAGGFLQLDVASLYVVWVGAFEAHVLGHLDAKISRGFADQVGGFVKTTDLSVLHLNGEDSLWGTMTNVFLSNFGEASKSVGRRYG